MKDGDIGEVMGIQGAKVLLPSGCTQTDVVIQGGRIVEIGSLHAADQVVDGRGRMLAPALIDMHGDAFERQVMPRPNVFFPTDAAVLETDRQLASNGIATAYHAVTLSWEPGLRSVHRGSSFIEALWDLAPCLTVENRVQLRWETFAFEAMDVIERALRGPLLPSIAFNDHTSMAMRDFDTEVQQRTFEQSPSYALADPTDPRMRDRMAGNAVRAGMSPEEYLKKFGEIWARRPDVDAAIRQVAALGNLKGAPMLSHDDTQPETRRYYSALGASISEFPMNGPIARMARATGDGIIFGAPNVVRGGSHLGSPSAADMVEDGLCVALASDYYYPAMLSAVARLHRERRGSLTELWSLVAKGPAQLSGLTDRGDIAVGKRADLVLVDWPETGTPSVTLTMSGGRIAYHATTAGN